MQSERAAPPIQVKSLRKSSGNRKVLNGIDLEVAPEEILAVLGQSGTGKSVLLKLLVGLQQPDSGSIAIHGQQIVGLPLERLNEIRRQIGFLFQSSALYDSLTVEENVAFPMERHASMSDAERTQRVRALLSDVGMEKDLEKLPSQISGGMQKRVGLARALALSPNILLFDEPTAGLDPITADEIAELIQKLHERHKLASVIVTHDVRGAEAVADRVALMRDGRILIEGSFDDLRSSGDDFVSRFMHAGSQ